MLKIPIQRSEVADFLESLPHRVRESPKGQHLKQEKKNTYIFPDCIYDIRLILRGLRGIVLNLQGFLSRPSESCYTCMSLIRIPSRDEKFSFQIPQMTSEDMLQMHADRRQCRRF